MADYLPKFKPGQAVTFTASADVTGGRLVAVTGNRRRTRRCGLGRRRRCRQPRRQGR
jgi:hypothetical protein